VGAVAGVIAAQLGMGGRVDRNDATLHPNGMVGVAPGVTLFIARVLDTGGSGTMSKVIEGLQWCQQQGAHIVSLSLGTPRSSDAMKAAFDAAWADGVISVAASGNSGNNNPSAPPPDLYPAAYPSVIAVGAVDSQGEHPTFSQTGAHLSLVAPGVNVLSSTIVRAPFGELEAEGVLFPSLQVEHASRDEYTGTLIDCGQADTATSCQGGTCDGFVAYVESGGLSLAEKVKNVQVQGARGVIIARRGPAEVEGPLTLGGPGAWPTVVGVSWDSADALKAKVGTQIRVGQNAMDYERRGGTSMATPHVAAVAALVWSARPGLTHAQVRKLLEDSAKDLGPVGRDPTFGFGLVQAKAALELSTSLTP
jgi:subtilisin family serine protease